MKRLSRFLQAGLLAAAVILAPTVGLAEDKPKKPSESTSPEKPPKARAIPFRGTVTAVDKAANTVTVGERVFHLSSETKLSKDGKPATTSEIVVGESISGNYTKGDDGKLLARTVRVGPKPGAAPGARPSKKVAPAEKSPENAKE